jgi:hypothetical protein
MDADLCEVMTEYRFHRDPVGGVQGTAGSGEAARHG